MNVITEYPIIENGKVITNGSRCGEKCSSEIPFLYQDGEYANFGGITGKGGSKMGGGKPSGGAKGHPKGWHGGGYVGGYVYPFAPVVQNPVIVKAKGGMSKNNKIAIAVVSGIVLIFGSIFLANHFKK